MGLSVTPPPPTPPGAASPVPGGAANAVRIRALVVEDVKFQRAMLSNLFERANSANALVNSLQYDVSFVEGGRQAIELLQREKEYDLILVDVCMPCITGDALLPQLDIKPTVAICMISVTAADAGLLERCAASGAVTFIRKPIAVSTVANLWQFVFEKNPAKFGGQQECYDVLYQQAKARQVTTESPIVTRLAGWPSESAAASAADEEGTGACKTQ